MGNSAAPGDNGAFKHALRVVASVARPMVGLELRVSAVSALDEWPAVVVATAVVVGASTAGGCGEGLHPKGNVNNQRTHATGFRDTELNVASVGRGVKPRPLWLHIARWTGVAGSPTESLAKCGAKLICHKHLTSKREHIATSANFGDVQRLPSGNTLVTYSNDGVIHEVTPDHEKVLEITAAEELGYATWRPSLYPSAPPPSELFHSSHCPTAWSPLRKIVLLQALPETQMGSKTELV